MKIFNFFKKKTNPIQLAKQFYDNDKMFEYMKYKMQREQQEQADIIRTFSMCTNDQKKNKRLKIVKQMEQIVKQNITHQLTYLLLEFDITQTRLKEYNDFHTIERLQRLAKRIENKYQESSHLTNLLLSDTKISIKQQRIILNFWNDVEQHKIDRTKIETIKKYDLITQNVLLLQVIQDLQQTPFVNSVLLSSLIVN